MKTLIKNGRIIDPSQGIDKISDVLIENGKIAAIKKNITSSADKTIDAKGLIVCPGLVDMHTHLREPGEESKETILTGSQAAIAGGFTTICAMPNTNPPCDNAELVNFILEKAKKTKTNILPIGTITKGRKGKELANIIELKEAGCIAISDDGDSVANSGLMRRALEYASMADILVISHCEDKFLALNGVMHEGYWSTRLGLPPIPSKSESIIVDRDIQLAELTGAKLHIAHVSTAKSVEIIRHAKKRRVNVTAEVTPHHFSLTDETVKDYNTLCKVNPPLRTADDVKAIKKALKDGTIDAIATDHAPHLETEKLREINHAPFGMIGLETALSLAIMNLIDTKVLTWPELITKLSTNPCKILNYNRGTLKPGSIADITIIDPNKKWEYKRENIKSKSANSPFIGCKLKGFINSVLISGKIVF